MSAAEKEKFPDGVAKVTCANWMVPLKSGFILPTSAVPEPDASSEIRTPLRDLEAPANRGEGDGGCAGCSWEHPCRSLRLCDLWRRLRDRYVVEIGRF